MRTNFSIDFGSELKSLDLGALVRVRRGSNRTFLVFEHGEALISYSTLVGVYDRRTGRYSFSAAHDYSTSTAKHVTQWSGISTKVRREWLADGRATLIE